MNARFLLSKSKVLEQYRKVKELADEVSYSLKTNPELGSILEENTDSKFSIHFINSLDRIKDKSRVWFLAQSWKAEDIELLLKKGVDSFIVDNESDLDELLSYMKNRDGKINLLLRMRLKERTIHTERHFVFGMYSAQINRLIPELRKNGKIKNLGIHFHRKTENLSEWSLKEELEEVLSKGTMNDIDMVNIGGGLPVEYKNHKADVLPYIFGKIKELKRWINEKGIKLIIEPGRFIAAPSVKLEAEIINVYENNIVINCSVYSGAMDTFIAHVRLLVEDEKESGQPYTIKGFTPDSLDVFRYRVYLDSPKVGGKILFLNAGAYTFAADFCDLKKLETVVVD